MVNSLKDFIEDSTLAESSERMTSDRDRIGWLWQVHSNR